MNFATRYLGLSLRSPFVVGASPLCDDVDTARRLQDAGAGAVVMRSFFEEQLVGSPTAPTDGELSALPFPESADYQQSTDHYLAQLAQLKSHLTIPVIASLNGTHSGAWTDLARRLEQAGADAIELNFYQVVTDPAIAADQVERVMLATVGEVVAAVRIPVAVKLSPFHSSVTQLAVALELEGANGLVLFNRFYQPDINTDDLEALPTLRLSDSGELLLRLRWLAILSPQMRGSLAAAGGVHTALDAAKAILTGADVVQLVSVLLRHGPQVLHTLRKGLEYWMRDHGFDSPGDFRGHLNLSRCSNPAVFERANYIRVLQNRRY